MSFLAFGKILKKLNSPISLESKLILQIALEVKNQKTIIIVNSVVFRWLLWKKDFYTYLDLLWQEVLVTFELVDFYSDNSILYKERNYLSILPSVLYFEWYDNAEFRILQYPDCLYR